MKKLSPIIIKCIKDYAPYSVSWRMEKWGEKNVLTIYIRSNKHGIRQIIRNVFLT